MAVGVIGPGGVADQWLAPALARVPGARLWSVLGRDAGRVSAFAEKHKAASSSPVHTDIESFLADPALDAVIIASPDKLHLPHALACARAGKHIFLEKPMATSLEDARAIESACRENKVMLMMGYHLRFHAGHQKLARLIAEGAIGEPLSVRISWTMQAPPGDWRAQSFLGRWWSLGALGTHSIDLAQYLLGESCGKITSVKGKLVSAQSSNGSVGHDVTSAVALRFASGATADIISSVAFRAPRVVEIIGSKGHVHCLDTLGARGAGTITLNGEALVFEPGCPYTAELTHFVQALQSAKGKQFILSSPACDARGGVKNVGYLERASR